MTITKYERYLAEELENFQEIAIALKPSSGNVPMLDGVDICGASLPLNGVIGGDHTIYVDFALRYDLERRIDEAVATGFPEVADNLRKLKRRAGILLADVAGHRVTDALIAAMLHQAFLLGVYYELDRFGEITTNLFEHINQRFFKSTNINRYLTMIYGEISDEGRFRFISAGHVPPMVFSREYGKFVHIADELVTTYPPIGIFPSDAELDERVDPGTLGFKPNYTVNEIDRLSSGDVILLYTDGLSEHAGGDFFPRQVETAIAEVIDHPARKICHHIKQRLVAFGEPHDDISFVAIKRTPRRRRPR